jgi:hypothetical protein
MSGQDGNTLDLLTKSAAVCVSLAAVSLIIWTLRAAPVSPEAAVGGASAVMLTILWAAGYLFGLVLALVATAVLADWAAKRLRESANISTIVPALFSLMSGLFLGLSDLVLADQPVLKWAVAAVLPVTMFIGTVLLARQGSLPGRIAGWITVLLPMLITLGGAVRTVRLGHLLELPIGEQFVIGIVAILYVVAVSVAILMIRSGSGTPPQRRPRQ